MVKNPAILAVGTKALRGVWATSAVAYVAPYSRFPLGVQLLAGQESVVELAPREGFTRAVEVKSIRVRLKVEADKNADPPAPVEVRVAEAGGEERTFSLRTVPAPGLLNPQLRLEGGGVFWNHQGALAPGTYELPEFAQQANAYLEAYAAGAPVTFRFFIKSDAPGYVIIEWVPPSPEVVYLNTAAWKNPLDGTDRVDRNLRCDFSSFESLELPLLEVPSGKGIQVQTVRLDIGGQLGPERLLGGCTSQDVRHFATLSSEYSFAHSFQLRPDMVQAKSFQSTGLSCCLRMEEQTELYFALHEDQANQPGASAPAPPSVALQATMPASADALAKCTLTLDPPPPSELQIPGAPAWFTVAFETAVTLQVGTTYWVVIKCVRGMAHLGLQPAGSALTSAPWVTEKVMVHRGGQRWKDLERARTDGAAAAPSLPMVGLVYLPEADSETAGVELAIVGTDKSHAINPTTVPQTVTFDLKPQQLARVVLLLRSQARGDISLANVIQEYKLI